MIESHEWYNFMVSFNFHRIYPNKQLTGKDKVYIATLSSIYSISEQTAVSIAYAQLDPKFIDINKLKSTNPEFFI